MKIVEIITGIAVPLTNEEAEVLNKFTESAQVFKRDLSPREQLLMDNLVRKDVINRQNKDGKILFTKKTRD